MKKFTLTFILTTATAIAFAQTINFGIKAGLNLSELTHTNSAVYGSSFLTGFNAGGIVDIGFQNFSIQPGVFFSTKGEKDQSEFIGSNPGGQGTVNISSKIVLNYIEVPVNLLYKSKIAPLITLNLGGGPYIGYGLSQTLTLSDPNTTPNYSNDHKFIYKNPDYGINFIAGIEINKMFFIDAGYDLGLNKLTSDDSTGENRVISISVGYLFR
jgi:hypothetical protein